MLGAEYLGLSSLFSSILQVLNMAELGFSSAVVYSMYKPIAEHDEDTICALMALYKKIYSIIGLCVMGVGLILVPALPHLIKGDTPVGINIYILYLLYLFNTTVSYFLFAYKNCLLTAHQRADITSNILTLTQLIQYCLQIALLVVFKSYYVYFIVTPIATISNNVISAIYARKLYPQYICKGKLSKAKTNEISKSIGGLMVQKVSQVSRNSFDSIFISAFLGLSAAAIYGNYYYIMSAVHGLMAVAASAMTASVGNSIVSESEEKNHKDFCKINFIYLWIAGWFAICLACLYQPFMKIWVGDKLLLPIYTMLLFCIYFYSNALGDTIVLYIQSAGLWWKVKKVYVMNAVANIVLNYVLVRAWGVFGIVLATIITSLVFGSFQHCRILYKDYFKSFKFSGYLGRLLYYFTVTCVVGGFSFCICNLIEDKGIVTLAIKALICIIVPNVAFSVAYIKYPLFKESYLLVKRAFGKRGKIK
jgi:O-antigen/teichoic acid export membrane protein